ncbi:MAG: heparinase II/III family protein, partial [Thermoguttaceae bacterium]
CALALLAAGSAFETDLVGAVRDDQDDWFRRHFENLIHSTLPNMRYIPWGDLQSGPNGGVTYEMAGAIDAMTWALQSPEGAHFSRRIAEHRGLRRFYGDTAVFYMLYTRRQKVRPQVPPTSFLAGNRQSGHFIARSGWDDGATVVAFRATDHFGDHNHYDQGSFAIYRNGLLAVDPPIYRKIRGPQQRTDNHNTLLIGSTAQRPARGQSFKTVEAFQENLNAGKQLETGDILFSHDAGEWAAVAGQFAQAYEPESVQSCVRQLLFVRPDKVVVVDQLVAPAGKTLPEVQWLLQVPEAPTSDGVAIEASNGKSWLRCRPIMPGGSAPTVTETDVNTHRVSYGYHGRETLALVHLLEVGDGTAAGRTADVDVKRTDTSLNVTIDGTTYRFETRRPFAVSGTDDSE